jgi:hypothetical protein
MVENIEILKKQDVITLEDEKTKLRMSHKTFTSDELFIKLQESIGANEEAKEWFKNGVLANVLVAGKLWRKGKVRLSIEFIPDENIEPPSLLDDFRK